MKSVTLKFAVFLTLLPVLSHAEDNNYKYIFKPSCNCIITKDNPVGIELISIFPYTNDPDVHEHGTGFYNLIGDKRVDSFNVSTFLNPKFSCQPCMAGLEAGKKYVFYFNGKPGMEQPAVMLYKDAKGVIREEKPKKED